MCGSQNFCVPYKNAAMKITKCLQLKILWYDAEKLH